MPDWSLLFSAYRIVKVRGDEVVQGVLRPGVSSDDKAVVDLIEGWSDTHFLHHDDEGVLVTLVRAGPKTSERWALHIALALLTLLTTTIAGAYFIGRSPLEYFVATIGPVGFPVPVRMVLGDLLPGTVFSVPLLAILFSHELGHYVAARRHAMDVSPPYFIPAPPWFNVVGTFGAFIRLRSVMVNRAVLLDVGVWGPIAGLALALPVAVAGMMLSEPLALAHPAGARYLVVFDGQPIWLGGSLLFDAIAALGGPGSAIALHPLAFAGWLGLFVTAMNLFPLAQLDGGHILYALVGERQRWAGAVFLLVLVVLGNIWWGWWLWAGLIMVIGRGNIAHPPVLDESFGIDAKRKVIGWICVAAFVLTFTPVPIHL